MIKNTDQRIQKYLTPYRYGTPVFHGSGLEGSFDEKAIDIPFVFWHNNQFYMLYTGFDGKGYQSALAVSDDLLHWTHKGVILKRQEDTDRWDRIGGAVTWILKENNNLWELPKLKKVDGKYWLVYHSYPGVGYESGPAEIGFAWTEDEELLDWHFPDAPAFSWKDGADWEAGGLYKACVIENEGTWYMFYNAKNKAERWIEQTGMAYSRDLIHWTRCEENPILRVSEDGWDCRFVSDPHIVKDGDIWVNYYFGYDGKLREDGHSHAQEGLALSKDLIHWEKVEEPIIPYGEPGSCESGHVHKASIVYYNDILYHFYCATCPWKEGDATSAYGEYRTICLATSKPIVETLLRGEGGSHILPFLWMKGENIATIQEELEKIWECGIREICLESRPHPDFCGPKWWESLDFILPWAKERGMKVWILDDDKFPTGHANGGFTRQPEKKKIYLAERHMDICGPCKDGSVLVECFMKPDGKPLAILAVPKPDGETLAVSGEGIIDLTDKCENGFVYFDLPEGRYRLFILFTTRRGGGRDDYMNLIDGDSVRVLIDEVYEKHYERYSEYFGNTIAGFFSDEPELGNVNGYPFDNQIGCRDVRLPWSDQLERKLRAEWGENFITNLPALWYESGEKTTAVRSQYMDHMTGLVRDCFSMQLGNWCAAHGVEYIGHIIEDDNAHTRMACSIGHYFREMEGQHMAGIDVVHHQIVPGFTEPVHQWIAGDRDGEFFHYGLAKLASSASHLQENKKGRALCEIFGNYGWAEGNNFMKWLTDHMLVRGINQFTPHAFSMTYPDRDCPPHFYARGNNPGFTGFTYLMKYMNRAADFLSRGKAVVDAAVLYHAESEWSGGQVMYFQKPGRKILEQQLDYDVVPADYLTEETACVKENCLKIGNYSYACLILPYAQKLAPTVVSFVEKAAAQGLPVWITDGLPEMDTLGRALPDTFGEAVEVVPLEEIGCRLEELVQSTRPVRIQLCREDLCRKDLRSYVREEEEGLALMLFNESITETMSPVPVFDRKYSQVTLYDPWTNEKRVYAPEDITLSLEPGESVFLYASVYASDEKEPVEKKKALQSGILLNNGWKISGRGELESTFTPLLTLEKGQELPNMNGRGYYPTFTGTYRYETHVQAALCEGAEYVLYLPEASDSVSVIVNGKSLGHFAGFPRRIALRDALQEGENQVVLEICTTLVWKRKDGASTHLQIPASGLTKTPVIEVYR